MLRTNPARIKPAAPYLLFAGLACAVVGAALYGDWLPPLITPRSPRAALARALGSARFSEGRLTGCGAYASPPSTRPEIPPTSELLEVSRRISQRVEREPSSQALADAAFLQLANGWSDAAITTLRRAQSQKPNDAGLKNDLAAALIQKGLSQQDPLALVDALESAAQALQIEPNLAEARFNLAVALERLHLVSEAIVAWRRFLEVDFESLWADEARQHLQLLESAARREPEREALDRAARAADLVAVRAIAQRSHQDARVYAQEVLLPLWGESRGRGDVTSASRALAAARAIGEVLEGLGGDRTVADAVAAVAERASDARESARLARGYELYGHGADHYEHDRLTEAAVAFMQATELLDGEAIGLWSEFWSAVLAFYDGRREHAFAALASLSEKPELLRYPALRGRVLWAEGLMHLIGSDLATSLPLYQASLAEFERLEEAENRGTVDWLISENFRLLGEPQAAWNHRWQALAILRRTPNSPWRHNLLLTSTQALVQEGRLLSALHFQNEELAGAERRGNSLALAQAFLVRSRIHHQLERDGQAKSDIERALFHLDKVPAGGLQDRVRADAAFAEAEILSTERPTTSLSLLSPALTYYLETGRLSYAASVHLLRARVNLALGNVSAAEDDLLTATQLQEQAGDRLRDFQATAFREQWQSLFDELVNLQVLHQERPDLGFVSADRAKTGKSVSNSINNQALSLDRARSLLPADHALIEYTVLADHLLLWAVWRENWIFVQRRVSEGDLERLVERVLLEIRHGNSSSFRPSAEEAFDFLIRPVLDRLPVDARLVIIPDKFLSQVPFAALVERNSGDTLLKQRIVSVAPSVSAFLDTVERGSERQRDRRQWRLLAIGNPTVDRSLFPELKPLPQAEQEVVDVARLYPFSEVMTGVEATREHLTQALPSADVLHFAGHALRDAKRPELSQLVLAPSTGGSQLPVLSARDLQGLSLRHLQLVVLSACSTAPGSRRRSEGVSGVAQAFLDGGARAVLATLWKVDDGVARRVLTGFHRRIARGEEGANALRAAQLQYLAEERAGERSASPDWAAFQLAGFVPPQREED